MKRNNINYVLGAILIFPLVVCLLWPTFNQTIDIDNFFGYGKFSYQFTANNFMTIGSYAIIFIVAALGLNVQVGYTGQLNLGYVAFMAVGGYSAALFQDANRELYQNHPFIGICLSLLMAIFFSGLVGLLVCLPTIKLRGDYFAIVTFGFAEVVRQVIKNEEVLRGSIGIKELFLFPKEHVDWINNHFFSLFLNEDMEAAFKPDPWINYGFFLLLTVIVICFVTYLRDSHYGRMLFAIRDNETAAESCGISLSMGKIYASVISAVIGGVAGYMMVMRTSLAHPDSFVFMVSIYALCCLVLGGIGSVRGAVVGAIILMSLGEVLRDVLTAMPKQEGEPLIPSEARFIMFGLVLILMMRFRPNGISTLENDTLRLAKKEKTKGWSKYFQMGDTDESS